MFRIVWKEGLLSSKANLDILIGFGREKSLLTLNYTRLIHMFKVILEREITVL